MKQIQYKRGYTLPKQLNNYMYSLIWAKLNDSTVKQIGDEHIDDFGHTLYNQLRDRFDEKFKILVEEDS